LKIAPALDAEVVSIDSAQVYVGMNIGTAKPSPEELASVRHHMIDVSGPDETISVKVFRDAARGAIAEIAARGKLPLLVGGSGLYFRAVVDPLEFPGTSPEVRRELNERAEDEGAETLFHRLEDLDAEAAARIEPGNTRRIVRALEVIEITGQRFSDFRTSWESYESIYDLKAVGLDPPRERLHEAIDRRVDHMINSGLIDEVRGLLDEGLRDSLTSVQTLGYAQVLGHIDGNSTLDEAIEEMKRRTRRFARRQMSWFRSDPRIEWFEDAGDAGEWLQTEF
jgi:tRNA dimethylallyltransferase